MVNRAEGVPDGVYSTKAKVRPALFSRIELREQSSTAEYERHKSNPAETTIIWNGGSPTANTKGCDMSLIELRLSLRHG
jgi:hypothetical protein